MFFDGTTLRASVKSNQLFINLDNRAVCGFRKKDGVWEEDNKPSIIVKCRNSILNARLLIMGINRNTNPSHCPLIFLVVVELLAKFKWFLYHERIRSKQKIIRLAGGTKASAWIDANIKTDFKWDKNIFHELRKGIISVLQEAIFSLRKIKSESKELIEVLEILKRSFEKLDENKKGDRTNLGLLQEHCDKIFLGPMTKLRKKKSDKTSRKTTISLFDPIDEKKVAIMSVDAGMILDSEMSAEDYKKIDMINPYLGYIGESSRDSKS